MNTIIYFAGVFFILYTIARLPGYAIRLCGKLVAGVQARKALAMPDDISRLRYMESVVSARLAVLQRRHDLLLRVPLFGTLAHDRYDKALTNLSFKKRAIRDVLESLKYKQTSPTTAPAPNYPPISGLMH